jgi:hypothetical protein
VTTGLMAGADAWRSFCPAPRPTGATSRPACWGERTPSDRGNPSLGSSSSFGRSALQDLSAAISEHYSVRFSLGGGNARTAPRNRRRPNFGSIGSGSPVAVNPASIEIDAAPSVELVDHGYTWVGTASTGRTTGALALALRSEWGCLPRGHSSLEHPYADWRGLIGG